MDEENLINIHEAKTNFSKLLRRVSLGDSIIIGNNGEPVAVLAPYKKTKRKRRKSGTAQGLIEIADDFNAPLPEDVLLDFEG